MHTTSSNDCNITLRGIREAFSVMGLSIFSGMLGFAAIAREAGFNFLESILTAAFVWGIPGQVAMASLVATGASLSIIFTAVALANMRMFFMSVSALDMLGLHGQTVPLWKKLLLMQMLAITSWIQLSARQSEFAPPQLFQYYKGFGTTIYCLGLMGAGVGYLLSDWVPPDILRIVIMMTPIYILMMLVNVRRLLHRWAVFVGGGICPFLFPVMGEWSILVAGIIGGGLVFIIHLLLLKHRHNA